MSKKEVVEVGENGACVAHEPASAHLNAGRPTRKRVVIGGVDYPPFLRQYHSRSEGALGLALRLAQCAGEQEVSEYTWLCMMGRPCEAAAELERMVQALPTAQRRELPNWSQETCKRMQARSGRGRTEVLDAPLIAALRERLKR